MCIVIDLDETLVHSSFKVSGVHLSRSLGILISKYRFHNNQRGISFQPISNADFIVPVEIDGTIHQVYVLKRPHVDEFLCKMGELFECVLFTASLAKVGEKFRNLQNQYCLSLLPPNLFNKHTEYSDR